MKYEYIEIGMPIMIRGKRWEVYSKAKHWVMIKSPEGKLKKVSLGQIQASRTMENYRKASSV